MILNCNQCVGRTLGNAYDSIKKIGDISFIKLSPSFPIDIRFNQEFKEQLEEIFDTMSLDMNLRVIENFETFKHQWTLPLQKSKHILEEMDKTLNNVKNSLGQNLSILPDDYNPPRYNGTASNVNHVEQEIEHYNKTSMVRDFNCLFYCYSQGPSIDTYLFKLYSYNIQDIHGTNRRNH
jgi:flagellin-specific chaperone FliS